VIDLRTKEKGRSDYVSVSIPKELIEAIDRLIEEKKYGYESRPELIKDAIRRLLAGLKPLE
jgi:metal-responsive CopG/Arc/MetJ family transcriptional regulator